MKGYIHIQNSSHALDLSASNSFSTPIPTLSLGHAPECKDSHTPELLDDRVPLRVPWGQNLPSVLSLHRGSFSLSLKHRFLLIPTYPRTPALYLQLSQVFCLKSRLFGPDLKVFPRKTYKTVSCVVPVVGPLPLMLIPLPGIFLFSLTILSK